MGMSLGMGWLIIMYCLGCISIGFVEYVVIFCIVVGYGCCSIIICFGLITDIMLCWDCMLSIRQSLFCSLPQIVSYWHSSLSSAAVYSSGNQSHHPAHVTPSSTSQSISLSTTHCISSITFCWIATYTCLRRSVPVMFVHVVVFVHVIVVVVIVFVVVVCWCGVLGWWSGCCLGFFIVLIV